MIIVLVLYNCHCLEITINSIARRGVNAILTPPPPLTTKDVVVVPPPRDTTFETRPSVTAACQGPDCPPDQTKT